MATVQKVGRRLREIFPEKQRVGVMIEGMDVKDHAHVVLIPFDSASEFRTAAGPSEPDHENLAKLAERLRF
jgi:hypothetical protein